MRELSQPPAARIPALGVNRREEAEPPLRVDEQQNVRNQQTMVRMESWESGVKAVVGGVGTWVRTDSPPKPPPLSQ